MSTAHRRLETFTAGHETAVDPAEIDRQLTELWSAASASGQGEGERVITRACLFNLVAVCPAADQRESLSETIRTLTSRHPCRAIIIDAQAAAGADALAASITAHCHLAEGGGKQVCCEQITLTARGRGIEKVPGTVLPLLESDLPTVLWWGSPWGEQPRLFERLSDGVDHLLVDTSRWRLASGRSASLADWASTIERLAGVAISDLSWTRLHVWRQLTADLFEAADCGEELRRLEQVTIVHGHAAGAWLRSRLFGGWLAAQLGWDRSTARQRLVFQVADAEEAEGTGLLAIELGSGAARFEVRKHYGEQAATTVVHMPSVCELPRKRAFWPTDDASLISQELDRPSPTAVYRRALALAAQL